MPKSRILVVDDEVAIRESLRMTLEYEGYECILASTGQEALSLVERETPDLVLLDVKMPGMDGIDVLERLRAMNEALPVIVVSGHGTISTAVEATKKGAFDFIEKPFDEARLLASIRHAVEKGRERDADATELENLQSRFNTLSARQREVMALAVSGLSNKELGSRLKISPKTVENHRAWVMERIGARNIAELVRIAMKVQNKP